MGDADELVFHWSNHPLVEHSTHSTNQTTSRWRPLIVRILRRSPSGRQPIAVRPGLAAVTLRQIGEVLQTFILQITFLMKAERLLTHVCSGRLSRLPPACMQVIVVYYSKAAEHLGHFTILSCLWQICNRWQQVCSFSWLITSNRCIITNRSLFTASLTP